MKTLKEFLTESKSPTSGYINTAISALTNASNKATKELKDGKRLSKILDKIITELEDETMFIGKGEYN